LFLGFFLYNLCVALQRATSFFKCFKLLKRLTWRRFDFTLNQFQLLALVVPPRPWYFWNILFSIFYLYLLISSKFTGILKAVNRTVREFYDVCRYSFNPRLHTRNNFVFAMCTLTVGFEMIVLIFCFLIFLMLVDSSNGYPLVRSNVTIDHLSMQFRNLKEIG
jgi:hypothetical protein